MSKPFTQQVLNLLNGVSQAPVEERDASQAEEQINGYSHRTRGLRKRPPTDYVAKLSSDPTGYDSAFDYRMDRSDSERYRVIVVGGDLKVFDVFTGAAIPLFFPAGKAYLAGSDFRAVTLGDAVVLLNRGVTVKRDGTQKSASRNPEALLYVRQADYETAYTVTLNGTKVSIKTASSSAVQARSELNTDAIAETLRLYLAAQAALTGFTFTRYGSTVYLTRADGADFTLTVSDGLSSKGLVAIKGTVQRAADLPTEGPSGIIVEVVGDPESTADNYFVTFDGHVWRECVKPGVLTDFDKSTLPHLVTYRGNIAEGLQNQGVPAGPTVGTGAAAEDNYGWQTAQPAGTALNEALDDLTSAHNTGFQTVPTGTNGTTRTITVRYEIDCGAMDVTVTCNVALFVNGVNVSSITYYPGQVNASESLEWTGAVPAASPVKILLTYSGGVTPGTPAYLTAYGNNTSGPGVTVQTSAGAKLAFDPALIYPVGTAVVVTLNGTPFTYNVTVSDKTGAQVATGIFSLIDPDPGFVAVNPSSGVVLLSTTAGAKPTTSVAISLNGSTTFFNTALVMVPAEHVGRIIKNLTDGSQGTVTANTSRTITVAALTGGKDNAFKPGDLCTIVGTGTYFVFGPATWKSRAAGDDVTCPFPSFVDRAIDEVFFYLGRLGFTARENVILSQAGEEFGFFRQTATDLLADDPIDIKSATRKVASYDTAVPWVDGVYLTGSGQELFRLSGGDTLTPQSVRLDYMGEYPSAPNVRPVVAGGRLFLISVKNGYTRVALAQRIVSTTADDSVRVQDLTKHIASYIVGSPLAFAADAEAEVLLVVTNGGVRRSLYVCAYHFDGDDSLSQLSWSRWDFAQGSTLVGMDALKGVIGLVFKRNDGVHLETLTLDPPETVTTLIGDGTGFGDGSYDGSGNPI